ncbi:hypothetical protein CDL12_05421 [Handroanthus impetiginosus]|uniref:Uncharacterized protein n=1 Tax=Handroanthus impetiginosus TaxID=429701 RepID=A0A2G9HWI1_9LAMI|nr:hypothetical protein CDL12_05421 [Handroanthus impetiginosus]
MAKLDKFEFVPLDNYGKNYLSWVVDAKMHLDATGLENTIVEKNEATIQNRAKAMIFLRHHLDESLKIEYLTERYDHLKLVVLPKARYDWLHLRLQDFKSISEYNSAMFKLTSQLMLSEQNNELLMKNYESRPTGSSPFPEANATNFSNSGHGRGHSHGRGRNHGRYNYRNYDNAHLDVADFFEHLEDKIDHLIGNENVQRN